MSEKEVCAGSLRGSERGMCGRVCGGSVWVCGGTGGVSGGVGGSERD